MRHFDIFLRLFRLKESVFFFVFDNHMLDAGETIYVKYNHVHCTIYLYVKMF
jgi:hypothetical protein